MIKKKSLGYSGRSSEIKKLKNVEKIERGPTDRPTDGKTDGQIKRGVESRSTRLKIIIFRGTYAKKFLTFFNIL